METKAEQYYPTYRSSDRDILLLEFEEAQKIANGQNKVYGQVTSILLGIVTFGFTFFVDKASPETSKSLNAIFSNSVSLVVILYFIGCILLRYFVDLQKQITINARKVVTLRTLLGLDYGHIHLTLPSWRVEGATNPFVIKYFNGWSKFKTMPFWILTLTLILLWHFSTKEIEYFTYSFLPGIYFSQRLGYYIIIISYFFLFRHFLNDRHESDYLNFAKIICWAFRIKLLENFEYILYRAKLSYLELDRLKINYSSFKQILIDIEDRSYYDHSGVSFKPLIRAIFSRNKFLRRKYGLIENGGSTLVMQLSRSLFIPSSQNKYLRKIGEVLLSFWINSEFSKDEILKLYVGSVRYERKVIGLSSALKYFFDKLRLKELSNEESFFLVERLSNITSSVKKERILHLMRRTKILIDQNKLFDIYRVQISNNKLKGSIKDFEN